MDGTYELHLKCNNCGCRFSHDYKKGVSVGYNDLKVIVCPNCEVSGFCVKNLDARIEFNVLTQMKSYAGDTQES